MKETPELRLSIEKRWEKVPVDCNAMLLLNLLSRSPKTEDVKPSDCK